MKFYSYTNQNKDYTKAVSLSNVRSMQKTKGTGQSQVRFGVTIHYFDGSSESFSYLFADESTKVYNEILSHLEKGADLEMA